MKKPTYEELAAQVSAFKKVREDWQGLAINDAKTLMAFIETSDKTSAQHLAEIRAEAIVDAIKRCNIYMAFPVKHGKLADEVIAVSEIKEYAEEIRKGGAK